MDLNEIITLLGTLLGVLTPLGGLTVFMYRKQTKKLKNAEVALSEASVKKAEAEAKAAEKLAQAQAQKAEAEAKAENWNILKSQLESMKEMCDSYMEQNKVLIQRNADLVRMNAEKEDRHQQEIKNWEARFTDQTKVLRNAQRNEKERADEVIRLTEENGLLRVELEKKRCDDMACPFRLPPNAYTPPQNGVSKEEHFSSPGPRPSVPLSLSPFSDQREESPALPSKL